MRQRKDLGPAEWCALIKEQEDGNKSIAAFCRSRGLLEHRFYRHRHQLRATGTTGFQKVTISSRRSIDLMLDGDGWRIELKPGFDAACLREVVEALR